VTLRSGYSEAQQYLFGAAPNTALAAPAAAGATNVSVNSVTGFYAGGPLTIGTGASAQSAQITGVGTSAASLKLYAAAAAGDTNIKVTSVANLAAGAPVTIDSGTGQEQATIDDGGSAVGRGLIAGFDAAVPLQGHPNLRLIASPTRGPKVYASGKRIHKGLAGVRPS